MAMNWSALSDKQLARVLGLKPDQVGQLIKRDCPRNKDLTWDVVLVLGFMLTDIRRRG